VERPEGLSGEVVFIVAVVLLVEFHPDIPPGQVCIVQALVADQRIDPPGAA